MEQDDTIYGGSIDKNYSSVSHRLSSILSSEIEDQKNLFAELERRTGIARDTWRQWSRNKFKSEPSARLIQAAALEWPQFAFWLITGYSDSVNGHANPKTGNKVGRHSKNMALRHDEAALEIAKLTNAYFKASIDLIRKQYGESTEQEDVLLGIPEMNDLDQKKLDILWDLRQKKIIALCKKLQDGDQKN
jgi:hypothetical protein